MDMRYASHSSSVSYPQNANPRIASASLLYNDSILGLSDADSIGRRHLPASATASSIRGRQILERLFTVAKIDNASAVAGALMNEFGSIGAVLHAQYRATENRPAEAILSLVREAILVSLKDDMLERDRISRRRDGAIAG